MKKLITLLLAIVSVSAFSQTKLDSLVLDKVNEYRVSLGLNKVVFDKNLYDAAKCQATYLKSKGVVGHDQATKGFETLEKRLFKFNKTKFTKAGEVCNFVNMNINDKEGYDKLASKIVEEWKKSPSHNKAITDPDFKYAASYSDVTKTNSGFVNIKHYDVYTTMVFTDK